MNVREAYTIIKSLHNRNNSLLSLGQGFTTTSRKYDMNGMNVSGAFTRRITAISNELANLQRDIEKALENIELDI